MGATLATQGESPLAALRARRRRPLRVLLVQLPIQELVFRRVRGNEPIAPGYLKAIAEQWAAESGHARDVEVTILPREVVDRQGDAALARTIAALAPDVLGLSLFLWSSARSVALARSVKALRPETAVLVGGPEVTRDNGWCVTDPGVDVGVVGEGEATFLELLGWLLGEGPDDLEKIAGLALPIRTRGRRLPLEGEAQVHFTPGRPTIDLARVPSPYLSGAIGLQFDRFLSVETLRGCPFKCSFCYYYKQFAKTTAFPKGWVDAHFRYAREHGAKELFFLDPTLNARPRFSEFLDEVIRANEGHHLELHAELVADMVDEKIADKLERANFKAVECGLQSTNAATLKAVNRMCDLERFARGATLMDRRGIVVKTDLILGLPEDDEASIRRSIAWVRERKLDADVQVFHLMVLPGTELREKADVFGYERLTRPPYYATRTRWLDEDGMRRLIAHAGEVFELEFDPPARPLLGAPTAADAVDLRGGPSGGRPGALGPWTRLAVDLGRVPTIEAARARGREAGETAANALTVALTSRDLGPDLAKATTLLREIARANPSATIDLVVEGATGVEGADARALPRLEHLAALKGAAATPDAYLNGYHRFQVPEGSLVATRVTVIASPDAKEEALEALEAVVPVTYRVRAATLGEAAEALAALEGRSVLLERTGALAALDPEALVTRLEARVGDDPDALHFADVAAARAWDERLRGEDLAAAPPEVVTDLAGLAALASLAPQASPPATLASLAPRVSPPTPTSNAPATP